MVDPSNRKTPSYLNDDAQRAGYRRGTERARADEIVDYC